MRTRKPRQLRHKGERGELRAVVDETIALFHRLSWVADQIYGEQGHGVARRGILRGLVRYGPQSVPQLARARSVRRQTIQPIVDALVREGVVELIDNPAHMRSRLVQATAVGVEIVERMDRVDARVLRAVGSDIAPQDLEVTITTLRLLRSRFETTMRWRPVVDQDG
jgi:DNA-binding MarR family transcriptional regulator